MKYNPEKVKERLKFTPMEKRVWIYNADIIMEFLEQTFMPTSYFLKPTCNPKPGKKIDAENFYIPEEVKEFETEMMFDDLYKTYLTFRNYKKYTSEIESRYKFGIIIGKLRFYKNGWELMKVRRGRKQTIIVYPLVLRVKVSEHTRAQYPIQKPNILKAQVEVDSDDLEIKLEDNAVSESVKINQHEIDERLREQEKNYPKLHGANWTGFEEIEYEIPVEEVEEEPITPTTTNEELTY